MKSTVFSWVLFLTVSLVYAQQSDKPAPMPEAEVFVTDQSVQIDGKTIALKAHAGTFKLRDEQNKPIALFGFTYYEKKNAEANRPIIFSFNGGPGSSSYWLHMGIMGPKRIVVNDPDFTPGAPYQLVNNEYSILDMADVVMMDPIGTGLSVPIGDAKFEDFWGVDQDIRSISLFITQFLIEHGRMNSPKYLLGESYGTFRNAGVMKRLQDMGIAMNGVVMVSAVFDLRTLVFPPSEDISYLVHFPTYATTAWYHDRIDNKPASLEAFVDEIRAFTENEYMPALYKGDRLSEAEKQGMAEKLAGYTGLSADYWYRADLRVTNSEFFNELMRDESLTVGRLDSRYYGINEDGIAQNGAYDPQSAAISPAYTAGFLHYFHEDLKVGKHLMYMTSAGGRKGFRWDWSHQGNFRWNTQAAIQTATDMATAMTKDPNMKVLIMNGYYDIATVFYGVEYTIDHLGLPKSIKDNIIMEYYEAGHMMYTHPESMVKFKKDLANFVRETTR